MSRSVRSLDGWWKSPVAVLGALLVTFAITAVPIWRSGANPISAYRRYLITPLTSSYSIQEVLLTATPLVLTGMAVAIAFKAGYFNIGAEGQFLVGAIGASLPGIYASSLPAGVALPFAMGAGAVFGLVWASVPAALKRWAGIDEVVTTLLLNPVALLLMQGLLNGPLRNPTSGFPDSETYGPGYRMPFPIGDRVHFGLVIGLVVVVVFGVVMTFSPLGLRVRASGQAPDAARFSGIDVGRVQWRAALISGAIAGLAGACQVLGVQHQLTESVANNYGYNGIVVATLGGLTAVGTLLVALLLGDIAVGAQSASLGFDLPFQMGDLVTAVLLLSVVSALVIRRRLTGSSRPGSLGTPTAVAATGGDA